MYRPSGNAVGGVTTAVRTAHGRGFWWFPVDVRLDRVARWRLVVDLDGNVPADAPFDVVAAKIKVRNPKPRPVSAELVPATASPFRPLQCLVRTSLVTKDPDFEIVRYHYRRTVDGKVVRAVRSAALSDVQRKGLAGIGKRVRCSVTPSDGGSPDRPRRLRSSLLQSAYADQVAIERVTRSGSTIHTASVSVIATTAKRLD